MRYFLSSLIVKIEVMLHKKLAPPQGSRRMKAPPMLSPDSLLVLAAAVALGAITTPSSQETLTVPTVRGSGPTDRWLYVSSRFHRAGVSRITCAVRRSPRISTESNCLSWLTLPSALQLAWSRGAVLSVMLALRASAVCLDMWSQRKNFKPARQRIDAWLQIGCEFVVTSFAASDFVERSI